jgi:hypothetical protein
MCPGSGLTDDFQNGGTHSGQAECGPRLAAGFPTGHDRTSSPSQWICSDPRPDSGTRGKRAQTTLANRQPPRAIQESAARRRDSVRPYVLVSIRAASAAAKAGADGTRRPRAPAALTAGRLCLVTLPAPATRRACDTGSDRHTGSAAQFHRGHERLRQCLGQCRSPVRLGSRRQGPQTVTDGVAAAIRTDGVVPAILALGSTRPSSAQRRAPHSLPLGPLTGRRSTDEGQRNKYVAGIEGLYRSGWARPIDLKPAPVSR